jgi:RNA polymerase sigma factor (sigma-70 family)
MQQQKHGQGEQDNRSDSTLFDLYGQSIFAYMRLHVSSREDAEDLTAEVFIAACEQDNLSDLQTKEQLAWLRRVAHNKLVDSYRRQARRPAVSLESLVGAIYEDEAQTPEQIALRHEELAQLRKAIGKLSPMQQQVLQLRYSHGLPFADIAILLEKREDAVRQLLSRTLAHLGALYRQQ